MGLLDLAVDQAQALGDGADVGTGRLGGAGGDGERLLAQDGEHGGGVDPADAVCLEDLGDGCLAAAARRLGRRYLVPEGEEAVGGDVVAEVEGLRVVAPELLADAVGQAHALLAEVLGHARPFPELDDDRVACLQSTEAMAIGAQGAGEHMGVAAVVLGAGDGEAVAEAVELLGVDGMDGEALLEQGVDHGAVRHLDGNGDRLWRGAAGLHEPVAQLGQAASAVGKRPFAQDGAKRVHQAHLMRLGRPVDAGEPFKVIVHRF